MKKHIQSVVKIAALSTLAVISVDVSAHSIISIADTVSKQAEALAKLLSITAYIAGVGFALAGVLQFKAHKENPQQIPLSKPVVTIIVASCLLYLPSTLNTAGNSLFGESKTSSAKYRDIGNFDGT